MVASAGANLEWSDAVVMSVLLATMALALQAVKVFVCLSGSSIIFSHSHYESPSFLWFCLFYSSALT